MIVSSDQAGGPVGAGSLDLELAGAFVFSRVGLDWAALATFGVGGPGLPCFTVGRCSDSVDGPEVSEPI